MLFQHHALIEFLVKKEFPMSDNYTQLQGMETPAWVLAGQMMGKAFECWKHRCSPSAPLWSSTNCSTERNKGKINVLIRENQDMTGKWQHRLE